MPTIEEEPTLPDLELAPLPESLPESGETKEEHGPKQSKMVITEGNTTEEELTHMQQTIAQFFTPLKVIEWVHEIRPTIWHSKDSKDKYLIVLCPSLNALYRMVVKSGVKPQKISKQDIPALFWVNSEMGKIFGKEAAVLNVVEAESKFAGIIVGVGKLIQAVAPSTDIQMQMVQVYFSAVDLFAAGMNAMCGSMCLSCHKYENKPKRCSKCKKAIYCSVECQRSHWGTVHSFVCSELATQRARFAPKTVSNPSPFSNMLPLPEEAKQTQNLVEAIMQPIQVPDDLQFVDLGSVVKIEDVTKEPARELGHAIQEEEEEPLYLKLARAVDLNQEVE